VFVGCSVPRDVENVVRVRQSTATRSSNRIAEHHGIELASWWLCGTRTDGNRRVALEQNLDGGEMVFMGHNWSKHSKLAP
jgi:hypothetical protein